MDTGGLTAASMDMGGAVEQAVPAVATCAGLALRRARLPAAVEATARAALARPGHVLGALAAPRWARLFLTWIDALVGAPLDPYLPGAVACDWMAAGYDLLDRVYDSPPEERDDVLADTLLAAFTALSQLQRRWNSALSLPLLVARRPVHAYREGRGSARRDQKEDGAATVTPYTLTSRGYP